MKIRPFPLFRVLTTQFRDGSSVFAGARKSRTYVKGGVACIGVGALAITPYFHPSSWFTGGKKEPETYQHEGQVGQGSTLETLMSWASAGIGNARSSPTGHGVLEKETKPDSASVAPFYSVFTSGVKILQGNSSGVSEKSAETDNGARGYITGGIVVGVGIMVLAICWYGLDPLGFTPDGIRKGSWAAEWMSKYAIKNDGRVKAGSLIAKLQSAGVLGPARETIMIIWAAGSVVGVKVADLFKKKD